MPRQTRPSIHQQSLVRDRNWWALSPAAGISWPRNGQNPRPHRPAGGRRPNPCRERWRHSSPRPPPPQRAGRLRLGLQHHDNSPIRFMAMSSSAFTGSPLRSLSEASIPADSHATARAGKSPRPTGSTGSPRKSRRATSRLRVTVHRWPSPSGPAGETWPGENVDEPSSPSFTTGPSTATLFSKLSVMFRSSLDTSIKPIPRNRVRLR